MNGESSAGTQTKLRLFPITSVNLSVVLCDQVCQTAAHASPKVSTENLIPLLEFVPYEEIEQQSVRVRDLPRQAYIQFNLPIGGEVASRGSDNASFISNVNRRPMSLKDDEAQTNLRVTPHVLQEDQVASVYLELATQTSLTFEPNESQTKIIQFLQENYSHSPGIEKLVKDYAKLPSQQIITHNIFTQTLISKNESIIETHDRLKIVVDSTVDMLQSRLNDILKIYAGSIILLKKHKFE